MSDIGTQDAPVDRRAVLLEQFDAVESGTPAADKPVPAAGGDRARDDGGRFAKGSDTAVAAPEKTMVQQAAGSDAAVQQTTEPAWKRPPTSWKKDFHETYGGLDPRVQEYIWQRETETRAGIEPLIPKAKFADDMQRAIEPHMGTIRGLGIEPAAAVGALMDADNKLRTLPHQQKLMYAAQLLGQYGIDLRTLAGGDMAAQLPQQVAAPEYNNLQQALVALNGRVATWEQQAQAAEDQRALREINTFAASADHFEDVRPTMVDLLKNGMATDLKDAYEKAIRLNPEVFDAIQASKQAAVQTATITKKDSAAKSAKAAAVQVRGVTPGAQTTTNAKDRRSTIAEALDNVSERL